MPQFIRVAVGFAAVLSGLLISVLLEPTRHAPTQVSALEFVNILALFALMLILHGTSFLRKNDSSLQRLALVILTLLLVFAACPLFLLRNAQVSLHEIGFLRIGRPFLIAAGVFMISWRGELRPPAAAWESFLLDTTNQLNLSAAAFLLIGAGSMLAGASILISVSRAALVALLAWFIPLLMNSNRDLNRPALWCALLVSAAPVLAGTASLGRQSGWLQQGIALLEEGNYAAAKENFDSAIELDGVLRRNVAQYIEPELARYHESKNQLEESTTHWERVADLQKIDRNEFLPLQRVLCERGDSLSAWRRLVFKGFSSLNNPEIEPGIKRLAEISPDVRAKLLAALLAWDQNAPEAERKKKLEDVQKAAPNEPSSRMLLQRMGIAPPPGPLSMPLELLVAPKSQHWTVAGSLEDNGTVGSLVVLEPGKWEMTLRLQATPLNEEWPIIRVELNGKSLGSTQVAKSEPHLIPFTFEVGKGDIYRIAIVFENQRDELEGGRIRRRGLTLHGIQFTRSGN